jgi:dihydrofolate synthase/folylpolyglutamate synthase
MVSECLSESLPLSLTSIESALQTVQLPGRMQIIPGNPRIVLDVAHNPQAVQSLRDNLEELALDGRWHAVFGILSDKDLTSILPIIAPLISSWHLVDTSGPRGQSADGLLTRMTALGITQNLFNCGNLPTALQSARQLAGTADAILVFGSFLVVGEFLDDLNESDANELI